MVFANKKKIFKNNGGEIHVGNNSPEGFFEASIEEVKTALADLGNKKLWRCNVCNDLSIAEEPLKTCTIFFQDDAYVEINKDFIGD